MSSLLKQQFRELFKPEELRTFRAYYEGINHDRPLETTGIAYDATEPMFRLFVRDKPESEAFVSEFLPQMGMFLRGPFPLPGKRVSRSARDCRGKASVIVLRVRFAASERSISAAMRAMTRFT
jgi:hypothetical protein